MSKRMSGPKRRRMYWGLGRLRSILMATATIDIANLQVFVENGGRTLLSYVGLTFEEVVQYEVCRMSTIGIAGSTARFHGKSKNSTNGTGARWYTWMISRLFSYVSDALFEELTSGSGFCNGASSQGVEHTCVAHAVAHTVEAALADNYRRAIEMQMMKAVQMHPAIVLIISIDLHFRNYKHGVYVSSLDEPCEAHTHAVTLLGWGTYEEKITGFGLKKRKRDEALNVGEFWHISNRWGNDWGMNGLWMEARAGNAYEGARYEVYSKRGKLASGDSPPGEWKLLLLPALFLLLFIIIMGCHLVAIKAEQHLILIVNAEVVASVQGKLIVLWIVAWRRYGILKSNTCFVFF
ncbi:hypothetical protein C1H46_016885 [Malus baccata]|uniref:Peptidase C1A papain C-terminal domain-containing protein n=1 Tax=Malus baccata TaxID=106549 RepID=A0A540MFH7_MALBA|nr:hypothetical protein C1H46_016885 [Malus baccata]